MTKNEELVIGLFQNIYDRIEANRAYTRFVGEFRFVTSHEPCEIHILNTEAAHKLTAGYKSIKARMSYEKTKIDTELHDRIFNALIEYANNIDEEQFPIVLRLDDSILFNLQKESKNLEEMIKKQGEVSK